MTRAARCITVSLLLSLYILGLSGLAATGRPCCCDKSVAITHYCCMDAAAARCACKPGIGTCHATETAKASIGPLAVIEPAVVISAGSHDAESASIKDIASLEGYSSQRELPPRPIS